MLYNDSEALVTPSVLKWARHKSYLSMAEVASRLDVDIKRIVSWEHGILKPTLAQAVKLADLYDVNIGVFYLPKPPEDYVQNELHDIKSKLKEIEKRVIRLSVDIDSYIEDYNNAMEAFGDSSPPPITRSKINVTLRDVGPAKPMPINEGDY